MRVIVLAYSLHRTGGTERSIINLCNGLIKENYDVILFSLVKIVSKPSFPLDSKIKFIELDILGKFSSQLERLLAFPSVILNLRKQLVLHSPDSIICFGEKMNILIGLSMIFSNTPLILSENYPPGIHYINPFWSFLRRVIYKRAKYITVLTNEDIRYFTKDIQEKTVVVPNIVGYPKFVKKKQIEHKVIIAVGRLDRVKRFDMLIEAFFLVNNKYSEWCLNIWGDGPLKSELQLQINRLGLERSIFLKGITMEIYEELSNSDMLVLSSEYESFGFVICEAMSVGIPVISFDCPTGPRNIIRDQIDGILVPPGDYKKMAEEILRLIERKDQRLTMGTMALEVTNRFSETKIINIWKGLLNI